MKLRTLIPAVILLLAVPALLSNQQNGGKPMKIAVSKATENYVKWLKKGSPDVEIINMSELPLDQVSARLNECAGLLVTGGVDVNPGLYGKPAEAERCLDIDNHRDSLEQLLIRKALVKKMPVVGICRGEQMINITLGGTLWIDLPTDYRNTAGEQDTSIRHQCADYLNCFHAIRMDTSSILGRIIGNEIGVVTTNHHQAVQKLAPGLRCNATSPDGLTEGIEWEKPAGKSFLAGVQWHPERMDTSNVFSGKLLKEFLLQSEKYLQNQQKAKK